MNKKLPQEFKTDSLALCPFLQMNGLKYLRTEPHINKADKPVVVFVFEDIKGIGKDLELEFANSEFKRYRDLFFIFRNEIEKMKNRLYVAELSEQRKLDEKYNSDEV